MRLFLFAISLLSFVMYKAAGLKNQHRGTWKESYRTAGKKAEQRYVSGPGNEAELYSSEFQKYVRAAGTFAISDSKISIACIWPKREYISVIMKRDIRQKQYFANWEREGYENPGGNFYLAKTGSK